MYSEILSYMGHKGDADTRIIKIIASCLEKLVAVSEPRYVIKLLPCSVSNDTVTLNALTINSGSLASHLLHCESAYIMAATLGASVDRLIARASVIDTLEALCLQACAASKIENYCDDIEKELKINAEKKGLYVTSRFSPGYGDFNIEHQHNILRLLDAAKKIGVTETKSHMLSPLKSVTAIIGVNSSNSCRTAGTHSWTKKIKKCDSCDKSDCEFRAVKGISYD